MNFYDRPHTLLEDPIFVRIRSPFRKPFMIALTSILLGFSAEAYSQPVKLGYAALSASQVAPWMAKEGGYLFKVRHRGGVIYIPAVAATQALIAGEIQLAQVTGVSTSGAILAGADVRIVASSLEPARRLDLRPPGNQDTGRSQREKTWDIEIWRVERNRCGDLS